MPEVFAWPPVFMTAYEQTQDRPVQRSEGLSGTPFMSQSEPTRMRITGEVSGIGKTLDGAAYIEALKILVDGKQPLVRVKILPRFWLYALQGQPHRRGGQVPEWTTGSPIQGIAGDDGWPFLDCTGLIPNKIAARPTERITVGGETALVLRTATAGSGGSVRIYLMSALSSGEVQIGVEQTAVFEIMGYPRAQQPLSGTYSYSFDLREVFANEFEDGFTEVNPWS